MVADHAIRAGRRSTRGGWRLGKKFDLGTREGTREVRKRPARTKQDGLVFVDVIHQEDSTIETGKRLFQTRPVEASRSIRCALEAIDHSRLVTLRLQATEQPGSAIRETLIVEIDRILCRQDTADAVRPRLLEQREHRRFAGRIRGRRKIPENLVHVENRAQRLRSRLAAHP